MISTVIAALVERGIAHRVEDDSTVATFCVTGEQADYDCIISADEVTQTVTCWYGISRRVPKPQHAAACELLTRANYGLRIGNFEMDLADGEVRFKVSVDIEGGRLGRYMIHTMMSAAASTFDRYYPVLMQLIQDPSPVEEEAREPEQDFD